VAYFDFQLEEPSPATWKPVVDVFERSGEFVVRVELPGVARDEIRLHWRKTVLTITGLKRRQRSGKTMSRYLCLESQVGRFRRDIALQTPIEFHGATAELRNGLLEVRLPKRSEQSEDGFIQVR
jgi:HSP20 family protein